MAVWTDHARDTRPEADIRPSVELQALNLQLLTGYGKAEIGVTLGESRNDASSNVTTVGTRSSSLRQAGLAQPVKAVLEVFGVLVDPNTFVSFN